MHYFTVAFGYDVVVGDFSSFIIELWGLERATEVMQQLIVMHGRT